MLIQDAPVRLDLFLPLRLDRTNFLANFKIKRRNLGWRRRFRHARTNCTTSPAIAPVA